MFCSEYHDVLLVGVLLVPKLHEDGLEIAGGGDDFDSTALRFADTPDSATDECLGGALRGSGL